MLPDPHPAPPGRARLGQATPPSTMLAGRRGTASTRCTTPPRPSRCCTGRRRTGRAARHARRGRRGRRRRAAPAGAGRPLPDAEVERPALRAGRLARCCGQLGQPPSRRRSIGGQHHRTSWLPPSASARRRRPCPRAARRRCRRCGRGGTPPGRARRRRRRSTARRRSRCRPGPRSAARTGVTNASMTPLTKSTATSPSATVPAVRPSRAMDWVRDSVARLDPRPEQPQPDAGRHEDRRQLEQPVRQDQPEEVPAVVVADHDRADDGEVRDVLEQQVDHREAEDPERQAQRRHPRVVDPDLEREVRGGVLAVVVLEVLVDELVDLLGRDQALLDRRGCRAATRSSRR